MKAVDKDIKRYFTGHCRAAETIRSGIVQTLVGCRTIGVSRGSCPLNGSVSICPFCFPDIRFRVVPYNGERTCLLRFYRSNNEKALLGCFLLGNVFHQPKYSPSLFGDIRHPYSPTRTSLPSEMIWLSRQSLLEGQKGIRRKRKR